MRSVQRRGCMLFLAVMIACPICANAGTEGLWIGTAKLRKVSRPVLGTNSLWDATETLKAAGEFPVRIIVHVDESGQARLLQKVILLSTTNAEEKTWLYVDEEQVADRPRDEIASLRRVESAAFAPMAPVLMTGTMGDTNAPMSATVTLDHTDSLNPFLHRYHPDHDNLDENFDAQLPAGQESYTVTRGIELQFEAEDPDGRQSGPDWGVRVVGGTYREILSGLHKADVYVEGAFVLERVSDQETLFVP